MRFSAVLRKVVPLREEKPKAGDDKADEMATPPPAVDGLVRLETTRHEGDSTFTTISRPPYAPRSASAPASIGGTPAPRSTIDNSQRPSSSSIPQHRPLRRAKTVALMENKAYQPAGGPEYVKILAKYKLLKMDRHQGLIVARFVNAGNRKWRKPEIIKVNQFSANGNQEFLAQITIGTSSHSPQSIASPQTAIVDGVVALRVDLDTGSADFWLFSTMLRPQILDGDEGPVHRKFDWTKSRTWKWPPTQWGGLCNPFSFRRRPLTWDIEYGDGSSAAGLVGFDHVEIGNIKIQRQAVQLASHFSGRQFIQGSADGVLGLAFGHLNSVQPERVQTPLENMITQGLLHEQVFTVSLSRKNCFFSFGFIDEDTRAGRDIDFVDIDDRGGFWNFHSRYARIGNKLYRRIAGTAIADTGSSIILTHPHLVWKIYTQIPGAMYDSGQPGWVYPKDAAVPEIAFSVGDDDSCMIYIDRDNMRHSDLGNGFVFGAVQENPAYDQGGLQFDIFGTPFFRQVYAIFDIRGRRFGVIKESREPIFLRAVTDSPVELEGSTRFGSEEGEPDVIEDSVDGSIIEEYPRRNSTVDSRLTSPIPEIPAAIPEEPTAVEDEAMESGSHST
jgi:hypothetical protein